MPEVTYCIPTSLVDAYRNRTVVVRAPDVESLTGGTTCDGLKCLVYLRLPLSADGPGALADWGRSVPLDLVLRDPAEQFPDLYGWTSLLNTRAVRVSIPTGAGFSKAVRLAAALQFDIKLQIGQPGQQEVEELLGVLEFYLASASVRRPVEPFHSVLTAFCLDRPVSMWGVQEEDPAEFREVLDGGAEVLPGRLAIASGQGFAECSVDEFERMLLAGGAECAACEFLPVCRGFFKSPLREYECNQVRRILKRLRSAAAELRQDLQASREESPDSSP
jgi:hypothetical protein